MLNLTNKKNKTSEAQKTTYHMILFTYSKKKL